MKDIMDQKLNYQKRVKNALIRHKQEYDLLAEEYAELHDIEKSIINQEKSKLIDKLYNELIDTRRIK